MMGMMGTGGCACCDTGPQLSFFEHSLSQLCFSIDGA